MSVNQIIDSLQQTFLEQTQRLERSSGFCQRRSRLSASAFVQDLVFGWLSNPQASVSALARSIAAAGAPVSPQGVQHRFNAASANLLRQVLEALMQQVMRHQLTQSSSTNSSLPSDNSAANAGWLRHYSRLWIRDSTTITLPLSQHKRWPGCGGATGKSAGMKVSLLWDWQSGHLASLQITPASTHDQKVQMELIPDEIAASLETTLSQLHLFDLGYFHLDWMKQLHLSSSFFCCRYKAGTAFFLQSPSDSPSTDSSKAIHSKGLLALLNQLPANQNQHCWEIELGKKHRLPCRLIVQRVPSEIVPQRKTELEASCTRKRRALSPERLELCGWNLWLTNTPQALLKPHQVEVLYRVRWQIERLFRLWKETLHIDSWRTRCPQRIFCEIYAKLIGAVLTQQITAHCLWNQPDRSLLKAAQTLAGHAMTLMTSLPRKNRLAEILRTIRVACSRAAKIENRRKKPSTHQKIREANQCQIRLA